MSILFTSGVSWQRVGPLPLFGSIALLQGVVIRQHLFYLGAKFWFPEGFFCPAEYSRFIFFDDLLGLLWGVRWGRLGEIDESGGSLGLLGLGDYNV